MFAGPVTRSPMPAGMVIMAARDPTNPAPHGWLKCNGAAISRTAYAALFDALGTAYGVGDGATTFNIPDMRGEFSRGYDDGRGLDSGRVFGTSQGHAFQQHSHDLTARTGAGGGGGVVPEAIAGTVSGADTIISGFGPSNYGVTAARSRSGFGSINETSQETRPTNVTMQFLIRY